LREQRSKTTPKKKNNNKKHTKPAKIKEKTTPKSKKYKEKTTPKNTEQWRSSADDETTAEHEKEKVIARATKQNPKKAGIATKKRRNDPKKYKQPKGCKQASKYKQPKVANKASK
jgi:hypothetical protein